MMSMQKAADADANLSIRSRVYKHSQIFFFSFSHPISCVFFCANSTQSSPHLLDSSGLELITSACHAYNRLTYTPSM